MLIISFDAVGDDEFERLAEYPAIKALVKSSAVYRGVSTVFVSNTYPIHASVATGVTPEVHGLISNTEPFPARYPVWNSREDGIRSQTLWQTGVETAAVFWPVTAYSKTIRYNIPEVLARPGKSQVLTSLRAGSKLLQLKMFLRHRKLLNGTDQPALDGFAAACMADILREYDPGLALVHFTAYDTLCHRHGKGSAELKLAFEALNRNLAALLEAAGDKRDVIVFSDHSQLNVHTVVDPNAALADAGLLRRTADGYGPGESGCFVECCGGSAFFHAGKLAPEGAERLRGSLASGEGFRRFLTEEELREAGQSGRAAFGFCAKEGYCYGNAGDGEKANHGYPLDMPNYKVFYTVKGCGCAPGVRHGGSLLDIAPLAARSMGIGMNTAKG